MLFEKVAEMNQAGRAAFHRFVVTDVNPIAGTVKRRVIYSPNSEMRRIHRVITESFSEYVFGDQVTGFVKGSSPRNNALRHAAGRYFYILDIKSAFSSVSGDRLAEVLVRVFPREWRSVAEAKSFLDRYCLDENGRLLVGAPASPVIFNVFAQELLDRALLELGNRIGATYTRYGDDITFSTKDRSFGAKIRRRVRIIIRAAGFTINDSKVQLIDRAQKTVIVTGCALKPNGEVTVPTTYLRKVKGMLFLAQRNRISPERMAGYAGALVALLPNGKKSSVEKKVVRLIHIYWCGRRQRRYRA